MSVEFALAISWERSFSGVTNRRDGNRLFHSGFVSSFLNGYS